MEIRVQLQVYSTAYETWEWGGYLASFPGSFHSWTKHLGMGLGATHMGVLQLKKLLIRMIRLSMHKMFVNPIPSPVTQATQKNFASLLQWCCLGKGLLYLSQLPSLGIAGWTGTKCLCVFHINSCYTVTWPHLSILIGQRSCDYNSHEATLFSTNCSLTLLRWWGSLVSAGRKSSTWGSSVLWWWVTWWRGVGRRWWGNALCQEWRGWREGGRAVPQNYSTCCCSWKNIMERWLQSLHCITRRSQLLHCITWCLDKTHYPAIV